MLRSFFRDRRGNFATMMALMSIPLCLAAGLAIDYSSALAVKTRLQNIADASALAMATSSETDKAKLTAIGQDFISANHVGIASFGEVSITNFDDSNGRIDLQLTTRMPTTFMRLAHYDHIDLSARAVASRGGGGGPVEIALVLDNTYSMSDSDPTGKTKLAALKQAATSLVDKIMGAGNGNARFSVVPYADYVTLDPATTNRNASWLSVPEDYQPADWCDQWIVKDTCKQLNPSPCTRYNDGIPYQTNSCGCAEWGPQEVTPRVPPICYPQKKQVWWGCVGSRSTQAAREDDILPAQKYPGYIADYRMCPTPIQALTDDKQKVLDSINKMDYVYYSPEGWVGGRPNTYLPSGLTWGLNVLTPNAPFTESNAASGDPKPRQILILMTDGDNTMALNTWNNQGRVYNFDWFALEPDWPEWKAKTDATTRALCQNIKQKHDVEIYSVAFMVRNDPDSIKLMEDCSSDRKTHYFDAKDASELIGAFDKIGNTLGGSVRLVQ